MEGTCPENRNKIGSLGVSLNSLTLGAKLADVCYGKQAHSGLVGNENICWESPDGPNGEILDAWYGSEKALYLETIKNGNVKNGTYKKEWGNYFTLCDDTSRVTGMPICFGIKKNMYVYHPDAVYTGGRAYFDDEQDELAFDKLIENFIDTGDTNILLQECQFGLDHHSKNPTDNYSEDPEALFNKIRAYIKSIGYDEAKAKVENAEKALSKAESTLKNVQSENDHEPSTRKEKIILLLQRKRKTTILLQ